MSGTKSIVVVALVTLAAAVALVVIAAEGTSASSTHGAASACLLPDGAGPGHHASIGTADNGKRVCVRVGERLLVRLAAPSPAAPRWREIVAVPAGVLVPAPSSVVPARGVTAGEFRAVRRGEVAVSSTRPGCAPARPGAVTCEVIELWRATVVVLPA